MLSYALLAFSNGFAMGSPSECLIRGLGQEEQASKKLTRKWTTRRIDEKGWRLVLEIFPGEEEVL